MATRAYVETSTPSCFFEARMQPDMVARRDWTRAWWASASATTELVTSLAVVDELERGAFAAKPECLELMAPLPLLAIDPEVLEVVQTYIRHLVIPADPSRSLRTIAATFAQLTIAPDEASPRR